MDILRPVCFQNLQPAHSSRFIPTTKYTWQLQESTPCRHVKQKQHIIWC